MDMTESSQINKNIYWLGEEDHINGLQCNAYLLVDGEEAVLFDPGSFLDFAAVYEKIEKIISLEKVKYVVLHHQDPDFCSAVPLFEKAGGRFTIVTHWRTQTIIRYYGINSDYYLVDEHDYVLKLESGRELIFVPTPYLHFPGAIATYDKATKTLFSSDLFGAFSNNWQLYADANYIEKMKTFHEHYMPSNDILRPVMEMLLLMDIEMIAPQHGSIIKEDIPTYIKALRDLECGAFLNPVKKNIKKAGGYAGICGMVIRRLASIYLPEEVVEALEGLDIETGEEIFEIKDYNYTGLELWENLFENVYVKKGLKWLIVIEPLVEKLSNEYELPMPKIFKSKIKGAQQETMLLKQEVLELREINERLNRNIAQTQGKITNDPVSGLYNENFLKEYLKTELDNIIPVDNFENRCLVVVNIDNMARIRFLYGDTEADNVLKGIVYILKEIKEENHLLFRLNGPAVACFLPNTSKSAAIVMAEACRNEIRSSNKFVEGITVSIGLSSLDGILQEGNTVEELSQRMLGVARMRLRMAKGRGGNLVVGESNVDDYEQKLGKILVVDKDCVNTNVLQTFLENLKYTVISAADGEQAIELAEKELPDLIISEIMLPKIDGFVFCEKLLSQSATKDIPFIIVSNLKNEDSVKRAISLGIEHYFQKPYILPELLGIVKMKVKGEDRDEA